MIHPSIPKASLSAILAAVFITACGGSGGGSAAVATTTPGTALPTDPAAPSLSGDTALDGYNWINYRRQLAGLGTLSRNAQIDAAALGHSSYQRQNNTVSHSQTSGLPGYTGAALGDRLKSAGYTVTGAYGEVISAASEKSGFYHAEELIGAIYHRFVIFEPIFREAGTGTATGNGYTYFTADFAAIGANAAGLGRGNFIVYPAANQTQVPLNFFSDTESPDPVPNQNEVGYPISVHGNNAAVLNVQSFTMRPRGGADLPVRLLVRNSDAHTPDSVAAIVPLAVLKAATVYDVSFSGTLDGAAASRNWSFTTK